VPEGFSEAVWAYASGDTQSHAPGDRQADLEPLRSPRFGVLMLRVELFLGVVPLGRGVNLLPLCPRNAASPFGSPSRQGRHVQRRTSGMRGHPCYRAMAEIRALKDTGEPAPKASETQRKMHGMAPFVDEMAPFQSEKPGYSERTAKSQARRWFRKAQFC
jgi:hypothetical protein